MQQENFVQIAETKKNRNFIEKVVDKRGFLWYYYQALRRGEHKGNLKREQKGP